ncbi:MAG: carbon starvation protein A [Spirochaetes bacterium]|nr:MAG: carbon starvation protein A [Spirochaetota bacterium]
MNGLLLALIAFVLFFIAYKTYGSLIAKKVFELDPNAQVPSREFEDGVDFVPTKKEIIFGHHFASIAGTGPIVGPAIGVIWGWVPAMIWIVGGSIFAGAVHDFSALVISMRNKGRSIGDLTGNIISKRARYLFFLIIFFELWIVIAIFAMIMGILFNMYPQAVFPVWFEIPVALWLGWAIYKKKMNITLGAIISVILLYITVIIGAYWPLKMPSVLGMSPLTVWVIIFMVYAYIASTLPVTTLLQPRDWINAHELLIAMGLIFLGAIFGAPKLHIVAPAFQLHPKGAPPLWPMLFVTIACGAISGFHSLVSSGTSSKQVASEPDAKFVGYGSMLMEGSLATLVVVATTAGIGIKYIHEGTVLTGLAAWQAHYSSWQAAAGLGSKLSAIVEGASNMMESIYIPHAIGVTIMGVFIVSFAGTTLDTATRIQRYVIGEFFSSIKAPKWGNRWLATAIAVITAAILAFLQKNGKGALILWPLFGGVNQLLAALALLVATVYLVRKKKPFVITLIPLIFMIIMTGWAMIRNINNFAKTSNGLLLTIGIIIVLLELWLIIEAIITLSKAKETDLG